MDEGGREWDWREDCNKFVLMCMQHNMIGQEGALKLARALELNVSITSLHLGVGSSGRWCDMALGRMVVTAVGRRNAQARDAAVLGTVMRDRRESAVNAL